MIKIPVSFFVLVAALPASAMAAGPVTIGISGEVAVVCRASLDSSQIPVARGETGLGELREFCNSPGGYSILVEQAGGLAGASLVVDQAVIPLSATGATLISASNRPAARSRNVSIIVPEGSAGGTLTLRIVPS